MLTATKISGPQTTDERIYHNMINQDRAVPASYETYTIIGTCEDFKRLLASRTEQPIVLSGGASTNHITLVTTKDHEHGCILPNERIAIHTMWLRILSQRKIALSIDIEEGNGDQYIIKLSSEK